MKASSGKDLVDWERIYNFILKCGKAQDPKSFAIAILDNISDLCKFDSGTVYMLDTFGNVIDHCLVNGDERWSKLYLGYYIDTDNKKYNLWDESKIKEAGKESVLSVHDWNDKSESEFVNDFVKPRGLRYTCGFGLYDMQQNLRMSIALDKLEEEIFNEEEIQNLRMSVPQLNNLHRNFFYQDFTFKAIKQAQKKTMLTIRESQIADLLCQSYSPANISQILHISQSTTYKHISNIYEKMNVSSQRELLAELLHKSI